MAYARWGDGDIYLFQNSDTLWICMECRLNTPRVDKDGDSEYGDSSINTLPGVRDHVRNHIVAGHLVPDSVVGRLERELGGYWYAVGQFKQDVNP